MITRAEAAVITLLTGGLFLFAEYARRQNLTLVTREELVLGISIFGPSLILGGLWAGLNYWSSGHPLPNTYYVKHNFGLGWFNAQNLVNIWRGYFYPAAYTHGFLALVTLTVIGGGAVFLYRRLGVTSLPLLLAPCVIVFALSANIALAPETWNFTARRYLDFIWPLLVIPFSSGLLWGWTWAEAQSGRAAMLVTPLLAIGLVAALGSQTLTGLQSLADEYAWNCRNIEEVDVAMGRWLEANTPPGAVIAVTDAGAMRYFSQRTILDMLGLNNHLAIGIPLKDLLASYGPDYAVLFRSDEIDSWPFLQEIYHIQPQRNTILGGSDLVAYKVELTP